MSPERAYLGTLLERAIDAVKGASSVARWVDQADIVKPTKILAVGKAAASMFEGLPADWRTSGAALVVTKYGHLEGHVFGPNVTALEASHPVPDANSLKAGAQALEFVTSCTASDHLLVLVSGGASALAEHLIDGVSPEDLNALTQQGLSEGADIGQINARRKTISAIKGGKLLAHFAGHSVTTLAISDVPRDDIGVIGSGLGQCPETAKFACRQEIVASNHIARAAIVDQVAKDGHELISNSETLYDDVSRVADQIAQEVIAGAPGVYVFGGEPTIVLPPDPGQGGRNQSLALELAKRFHERPGICGLVAGTDGTDGPTDAAGGFFDGQSFSRAPGADAALRAADAGRFLAATGDRIVTGPTGTNVMDVAIILKQDSANH